MYCDNVFDDLFSLVLSTSSSWSCCGVGVVISLNSPNISLDLRAGDLGAAYDDLRDNNKSVSATSSPGLLLLIERAKFNINLKQILYKIIDQISMSDTCYFVSLIDYFSIS